MRVVLGEVLHWGAETRVVAGLMSSTDERVAVKMPLDGPAAARATERLRYEHAMLQELQGHGALRLFGLDPCAQGLAIVMERWGETSLDRVLEGDPLPLATALRVGTAIARALGQVHRRGVIHRDIKPQNVLVNAERTEVRLIDFELATRRAAEVEATASAEQLAGTLAYMAPEQTGRMNRRVDTRADLYALGATLYELLTGQLPFATSDAAELIHAHIARTPVPAHERAPERRISHVVSAILSKLLEKAPEQRYQTAEGAAHDLERAAPAWEAGSTAPFALGERDFADRINRPSRLFGRDAELSVLREELAQAFQGDMAVVLVSGPSGVGKSALVYALREQIQARRGILAAGKFDQLQRGTPYAALVHALRGVVRRRLADAAGRIEHWKRAWLAAAGPNGRILVDLIPELAHFLGDPPPPPDVGMVEAIVRFRTTLQQFIRSTATAESPLALFLDDLQWADAASLSMLQELAAEHDTKHLFILGAYRDSEVDEAHPLRAIERAIAESGRRVRICDLAPLTDEALEGMVGDMLTCPATETRALASLVKAKTDGSPFFVEQFLRAMFERRLLARDLETGRWRAEAVERAGVTDNVVELLTAKIGELSPGAQRAMSLSACVGASFDVDLLAAAGDLAPDELRAVIDELVADGMIVPSSDAETGVYAFVHDRVQQAAYEWVHEGARAATHLALARALERRYPGLSSDAALFATLSQYLRASGADADERPRVAALYLRGAERAKAGAAHDTATTFLRAARELLGGDEGWDSYPELTFELHVALGQAEWLAGQPKVGEAILVDCVSRARDRRARARVVERYAALLVLSGRYHEAVLLTREPLRDCGYSFPSDPGELQAYFGALVQKLAPEITAISVEAWRALPRCSDPDVLTASSLLHICGIAAAFVDPMTALCGCLAMLELTMHRGISHHSLHAAGGGAIICHAVLEDVGLAKKCIDLALALKDEPGMALAVGLNGAYLTGQYVLPRSRVAEGWPHVPEIAEREGNLAYLGHATSSLAVWWLFTGRALSTGRSRQLRDHLASSTNAMCEAASLRLSGASGTTMPTRIDPETASSDAGTVRFWRLAVLGYVAMHFADDEEALRLTVTAEPLWLLAYCAGSELCMIHILTVLGSTVLGPGAGGNDQIAKQIAHHRARLDKFAAVNPETFLHIQLLANAGEARAAGRHDEADRFYDEAILDARRNGFTNHEALGMRLAAEHHFSRGRVVAAGFYLREAHGAYGRWGAHAVAERLREKYPDLLSAADGAPAVSERRGRGYVSASVTRGSSREVQTLNEHIDASAVLQAAQALSGDMVLDSLVGRMLRLLAQNAGAERAVLSLVRGGELRVAAQLTVDPEALELALDEPASSSTRIPPQLVGYVERSKEAVVLAQSAGDSRFEDDPYLKQHRPASVLAVPLVHRGRLVGVMYLEHPRAADAFHEARVELVTLLGSQAATAVENALLYSELSASNERLEKQVAERTAQLRSAKEAADTANKAKSDFLASMSHELRTPLNGILGYAQILERASELSDKSRDGVQVIRRSGEHLLTLVNDVLDLARIEAGKMISAPKQVSFPALLRTVTGMCRVRADQKGLGFEYALSGPSLETVMVDEKLLMQVLLNLLGNAIKFTQRGSVKLMVEVHAPGRLVIFRVEDTGPGIAPEHLGRIFEPFEQVGEEPTRAEGTGLGLSITRRIVDLLGGHIEVESALGKGSAFTVKLPIEEASAAVSADRPVWHQISGYRGERRTILVVDDKAENRAVVRDLLDPLGFEVVEAEGGAEAIELARVTKPALVVMDLAMPGMSGYEAARRLRQEPGLEQVAILASSAGAGEEELRKSREAGCDDFVSKPVKAAALLSQLERSLGLSWVYREAPEVANAGATDDGKELVSPAAEDLAHLAELAQRGRVGGLLDELERIEARDVRLRPWVERMRVLARGFRLKELQTSLRAR